MILQIGVQLNTVVHRNNTTCIARNMQNIVEEYEIRRGLHKKQSFSFPP